MKAEELRIGNFIMDSDTERVGHVVRLSEKKVSVKLEHSTLWQDIGEFEPIPLSEEVLLKCGFERSEIHENFYFIKLNDWTKIYVSFHEKQYAVELSISKHSLCPQVKYLHQLQNLYYSLTGEELEVKWS